MLRGVLRPLLATVVGGTVAWRAALARKRRVQTDTPRQSDDAQEPGTLERLRDSEHRYRALFASLDKGFCITEVMFDTDRRPVDFRFVEVNPAFERHTGLGNVVGRTMREMAPDVDEQWFQNCGRVAQTGAPIRFQNRVRTWHRWFEVYAFSCGAPSQCRIGLTLTDITQRRQTERALRASEARSRLALDVAQLGTWSWLGAGNVLVGDERFRELCGIGPDEALSFDGALARVHGDDRAPVEDALRAAHAPHGDGRFRAEFRCVQPDGELRWLVARGLIEFAARDGVRLPARMIGTLMDVTQRKRAERELLRARDELEGRVRERTAELAQANDALRSEIAERKAAGDKIRQLLAQLVNAQEDERRRLSRELHDTLGQHLAVLTLGLKAVQAQDGCPPQVQQRLDQIEQTTRRLEEDIDRLAHKLRPLALDHMGLVDALGYYADRWASESGVAVDVQVHGLSHDRLPPAVETTVYRVVQESLTNVRKHAAASRVSLIAERRGSELRVIVEDDGCGFDPASASVPADGRMRLGLRGMAERAALVAGSLEIESALGRGSTVYLSVPLDTQHADAHEAAR